MSLNSMLSELRKSLRRLRFRERSIADRRTIHKYLHCGNNTRIDGLSLVVRNPDLNRDTYLRVGDHSVVSGQFIFEIPTGQVNIGDRTFVGGGMFVCIDEINIGNDVLISWGCTFADNNSHAVSWQLRQNDVIDWKRGLDEGHIGKYKNWASVRRAKITVRDKAWIGFNSIILKGVTVGEGSIVGAGSVVTSNVPDWTVVAGNPAKLIRRIPKSER